MVDFTKLAADAKAAHEAKKAAADQDRQAKSDARRAVVEAGLNVLNNHVRPILDRAARELHSQGVESEFEEDFDVLNFMMTTAPRLGLRLVGPPRPSDGFRLKSILIAFGSLGETIDVYVGKSQIESKPDRPTTTVAIAGAEQAVADAVAKALDHYYANVLNKGHW